ncbi:hypothetical protein E1180_15685 [Roseibium denhamense]|uniref:Monosaccharide ABC transporter substrate-binding protein, CUT2 family n=1 Tax=Roseibium denhamense TaxID=76305 RepID=A0ABY1PN71_9HYPH|nr:substrate-binding domain-containing protein [Roseibium denhamense]MTI06954.1 hypothetical protein [Roseibium denhamense]SMP36710.1 monosaccharide ABC transporter substrate-binding protein, CUT2 family [Roseibium denhamense]
MVMHLLRLVAILFIALFSYGFAAAESKRFAIIPHSTSDENFQAAFAGARQGAEAAGYDIVFIGKPETAHALGQIQAIQEALELGVDGVGLAPLNPEPIIKSHAFQELIRRQIPVVLFESDFPAQYRHLRDGFVGTNGLEMGRALGRLANQLLPEGGRYLILAGAEGHQSIADRIAGVRQILDRKGRAGTPSPWSEDRRSPLYSGGDYELALKQLRYGLLNPHVDLVISAGWWPQKSRHYAEVINPFKYDLRSRKKVIISGDASKVQLEYLRWGLSQGNVGQNFYAMGQQVFWSLRRLSLGEALAQDLFFTPVEVFTEVTN